MTPTEVHGIHRTGARRRHRGKRTSLHSTFFVVLGALLLLVTSVVASPPPAAPAAVPAAATPKVLATFPVGKMLTDAAVSHDGTRLYVTDGLAFDFMTHVYTGGVHVVDTASKRVLATINVGNGPSDILLNRAGTLAYVLNGAGATISVVDLRSRSVIRTLNVPVGPSEIRLNAAETVLYVATNGMTVGLVLLDVQTGRTIANIPAGWDPQTLSLNAAQTTAYTVNLTGGQLTVIDLRARRVQSVINLGEYVYGVTVNPAGTRAYINGFAAILVVDLSTHKTVARIPLTAIVAGRMHLNRAGTLAYSIAGHDGKAPAGGILHVIDLASNTVVGTAPVGFMAGPIAFDPSGQRAYIPSGAIEGTVTLVQMPQQ